jgi:hypothetical protein
VTVIPERLHGPRFLPHQTVPGGSLSSYPKATYADPKRTPAHRREGARGHRDGGGSDVRSESAAKHSARSGVEALCNRTAVLSDRDPVHEDMDDAYGRVCGESLAVGREVVDPA